jgi:hypothetical protein
MLLLVIAVYACGGEDVQPPASGTITVVTATASPSPSPSIPGPASSDLEEALAGGERLAETQLAQPNLVYAAKADSRVTVFKRNMTTADEEVLLEYDEVVEARHLRDGWPEFPPSVALASAVPALVYMDGDEVITLNLNDAARTTLLTRGPEGRNRGDPDSLESAWTASNSTRVCCAYAVHSPVVARDGSGIALPMAQYEGRQLMVLAKGDSVACVLANSEYGGLIGSDQASWSATGDLLVPTSGGQDAMGVFVGRSGDPCSPKDVTASGERGLGLPSRMAAWSPSAQNIAFSVDELGRTQLMLMNRDGSEQRVLVDDGFNYWPVFSRDGGTVFFIKRSVPLYEDGTEGVWAVVSSGGSARKIADLPDAWSARTLEPTDEGYLSIVAWKHAACPIERKCADKLVVLDGDAGRVVYASADQGVGKFLGFLP